MIRAATKEDVLKIADLFYESMPSPWKASDIEDALSSPSMVVWVFEENREIKGALLLQTCLDEAEILSIATAPSSRRRGIGRALLSYALQEIGHDAAVFLEVRSKNEGAIAFYKTFGFSVVGLRRRYYTNPSDDALLMKFGKI